MPTLALDLDLRIGTLQWLLGLVVTGVGGLVLLYRGWYFEQDDPSLWHFSGVFVALSGAMLGLVLPDNLLTLYVYW